MKTFRNVALAVAALAVAGLASFTIPAVRAQAVGIAYEYAAFKTLIISQSITGNGNINITGTITATSINGSVGGNGNFNLLSVGGSGNITGTPNNVFGLPPNSVLSTGTTDITNPNQNVYVGVIDPNVPVNALQGSVFVGLEAGRGDINGLAGNTGIYEVNLGPYTNCSESDEGGTGGRGVCIGAFAHSTGTRAVCIGANTVCGDNGVSVGRAANSNFLGITSSSASLAMGAFTSAQFEHASAIGPSAVADSNNEMAFGTAGEYAVFSGGLAEGELVANANVVLTLTNKNIYCNATTAAVQVKLPTAAAAYNTAHAAGTIYKVIKTDSSANACVVTAAGLDTINGAAILSLGSQYSSGTFQSAGGTAWYKF